MDTRQAIADGINMGKMVCMAYLGDLTDEEMMRRPHPQCNHINWQVGHLIASEHGMIEASVPGSMPALPAGFEEKYAKDKSTSDKPSDFLPKQELMSIFETQRAATLAALEKLSDEQLEQPGPEAMRAYIPKVGSAFNMQASHWLMHCGQWVVVRRELGREILM
jgi:hypothetical protein